MASPRTFNKEEVEVLRAWASPYSQRVELALSHKRIPYHSIEQDIFNKSSLLLSSNPVYKKIPVLIHGHLPPICESPIIVQYIDETWPHPNLLPSDPHARAIARFWADFVDRKFLDSMFNIMKTEGEAQKAAVEEAKKSVETMEAALGEVGKGGPFFGGEEVGYVDIMLGPFVAWREAFEEIAGEKFEWEDKYPRMFDWLKAFQKTDIAIAVLPEASKVTDLAVTVVRKIYLGNLSSQGPTQSK